MTSCTRAHSLVYWFPCWYSRIWTAGDDNRAKHFDYFDFWRGWYFTDAVRYFQIQLFNPHSLA